MAVAALPALLALALVPALGLRQTAGASPAPGVRLGRYQGAHSDSDEFAVVFGDLRQLSRRALAVVRERLGIAPRDARHIQVVVRDATSSEFGADRARCVTTMLDGSTTQQIQLVAPHFLSGDADLEQVLAHEMVHAVMRERMGPAAYGRLPHWVREGLAVAVADQGPRHLRRTLGACESVAALMTGLVADRRGVRMYPYAWLAIDLVATHAGAEGLRRLARDIVAGRDVHAVFAAVAGRSWEVFERDVRRHARARFEEAAGGLDLVKCARRLYRARRYPETRTVCRKLLRSFPGSAFAPTARYLAARTWFHERAWAQAVAGFRDSLEADRGVSGWLDECQLYLGMALCEQGQLEEGRRALVRFVTLHPHSTQRDLGHVALGRVLRKLGRSEEARTVLRRVAALRDARPAHKAAALRELAALER